MSSGRNQKPKIKKFIVGPLCTNCYLVYDEASRKGVLIDPGAYTDEIAGCIRKNGIDVLWTVNTHGHADHISGDAAFGYPVLIHELDAPCLKDPARNLSLLTGEKIPLVNAAKFLKDGDKIAVGNIDLEVIHTPGHSPGSVSLKCDDVVFSGDALFHEGIGRTDLPEGDHNTLMKAIKERLLSLPDDVKVYPGHGPETTIGYEKENNPFL